jgi:SpoIVB peptidase S55
MRPSPSHHLHSVTRVLAIVAAVGAILIASAGEGARASEPDAKCYWDVSQIRPGMKGVGKTVMVGTKLEEFGAEVLGVMRDVSPGRDMVLCRLTGCNLDHSGIIQGMSGSPIFIDGKLLGAVAFAWEFAKDPIAGVTPFSQMVRYVRSNDRRIAAESKALGDGKFRAMALPGVPLLEDLAGETAISSSSSGTALPLSVSGGGMAGMTPIVTPMAASGFSARALNLLSERLRPLGMAAIAGGAASERILREYGNTPLQPGSPVAVALVTGDFDLSGIGTVTHVEGNRVYAFGHPMFSLGPCEFPMMTGYIHTVYPRASVSMKMGSPLKVVGVIDTDVSTSIAGRIGTKPDLVPLSVRVKTSRFADAQTYKVEIVREPALLPTLIMSVLTSAIDTEGNLPEELTARLTATVLLKGHEPIVLSDTFSGPRYTGPMGAAALFSPLASLVNLLVRNSMTNVRLESIACDVQIEPGRRIAQIESVRLLSDTIEPGQELKAFVTLKPFKEERQTIELSLLIPADYPEGPAEAVVCDLGTSIRRRFRNDPALMEPRDLEGVLRAIHIQTEPKRTSVYLEIPSPERGLTIQGQVLPNLPGSVRAVFASKREVPVAAFRSDLVKAAPTAWVVDGALSLRFTVVKDAGMSLSLYR